MEILILILVITLLLGRYAIKEGQRIERQKKFNTNLTGFKTKIKNEEDSN
tara:strand:+ start:938 stop:1087 length:150 start_codon:yes stop_codon:yes gene_type:complete